MESSHSAGTGQASIHQDIRTSYRIPLIALTSLFFVWGFVTCLNDILIPHLKDVFSLNYTQAMLIQFCFFGAFFIVSLPGGRLVQRIGYKPGLIFGLVLAGSGCLLFYPAATFRTYLLFLAALFVLASGITILQVSANPYVTVLGPQRTASTRLNLTQAFSSLGYTVAPFFGAFLILSAVPESINQLTASQEELAVFRHSQADAVKLPYLMLAITLFGLALLFTLLKLPVFSQFSDKSPQGQVTTNSRTVWSHSHLVLGAIGIFVYVGAEVSIGSLLINFLGLPNIAGMEEAEAANYVAYYWGGAMVGRFVGAAVMTRINPKRVLAFNAGMAAVLALTAVVSDGNLAMYSILLVGLCNSIMFPTIFILAVNELGPQTSQGSGILCLAIVGGALIPLLQGALADLVGLQTAYVLPAICYLYVLFYGLKGSEVRSKAGRSSP